MGQKVNPIGMRLQVNRTWDSRWYADTKEYGDLLLEDLRMREFIKKDCAQAGVSKVIIERPHKKCRVTIHTARPGVIIGKKGADIETLRKKLANMTESELHLNIIEVRRGSGSWECSTAVPNSLPFEVSGRTGSTRVKIKPAPPGVGLVTNQVGQIMLKLAGVEDAWSFTRGQTQTIYNFASAMFKALEKTQSTKLLPGQEEFHNMIKGVKQE